MNFSVLTKGFGVLIILASSVSFAETRKMDTSSTDKTSNQMPMHGMYGQYSMNREASGTSWQPQTTPFMGSIHEINNGMYMLKGFTNQVYDHQGGTRGGNKFFNNSMLMFMAQKDYTIGTFGFRSMLSFDPLMGAKGYPLLLQTGETANGVTELIDRQHPHDFLMELAGTYSMPLVEKDSVFLYVGFPGEPALGPPNYMMRWSSQYNPETPLTHHWLDSTHTSYGVVTLGYVWDPMKIELSAFNGREPDQARWNIEKIRLNSQSARISYALTDDLAFQMSYGMIKNPEQFQPGVDTNRATASFIYNQSIGNQNKWQTTLAWGQNANKPGHTLNGYMVESMIDFHLKHAVFTRVERVQKDDLFTAPDPSANTIFTVNKLSLGYVYEFPAWRFAKPALGALASTYLLPDHVQAAYSNNPFSYMLFGQISLA